MHKHERMFHHHRAEKLNDPERRTWLPPAEVIASLDLRPGMVVADIGAGTGYFAIPLAQAVGPTGRVYAVDLQPEMLDLLRAAMPQGAPIELVSADASRITLPTASVDLCFTANVWHELDDRAAVLAEFARLLRPAGRLAILDWRADVAQPPGPPIEHRVAADEIIAMLPRLGWEQALARSIGVYSYLVTATRR
jgi:ubiquinone/menaquinone biosynthesis C-methylase UbiE